MLAKRLIPVIINNSKKQLHFNPTRQRSFREIKEKVQKGFKPFSEEDNAYNYILLKMGLLKPIHTVQEQIDYMDSEEYWNVYKDRPIWEAWRRNLVKVSYKWQPPLRLFCIDRNGRFNVNHACPVCRDEYFFFHYENPRLLQHFVKPGTDQPISNMKTGLCQEQQINLQAQVLKAREYGTMLHNVEFRHFDYTEWYPGLQPKFGVAEQPPSRHAQIDEIYPNPDIHFEPHNRDYNTNWDEWWIRHEKFTRKGR